MSMSPRWASRDRVILREVVRDRVWSARPVTAVRDSGDVVALCRAEGIHFILPPPQIQVL